MTPAVGARPEAFERARARLEPLLQAKGFRALLLEHEGEESGRAFADYARRSLRIRLVWEGREQALWLESARQEGNTLVSRWQDVEWSLAGSRLPLDREVDEARIQRLAEALARFLEDSPAR